MGARHHSVTELIARAGADALLSGDPATVAWLTGHVSVPNTLPSSYALGPFVLAERDGSLRLIAGEEVEPDPSLPVEVVRFEDPEPAELDRLAPARRALAEQLGARRLLVEAGSLALGLLGEEVSWQDASRAVLGARAVKDDDEIARMRAAIELCDIGQAALRAALAPGVSELELGSAVRAAMERREGTAIGLIWDLVGGARTALIGDLPTPHTVGDGELVLCDLQPCHGGMWGDCCATVAVGSPSRWAIDAHRRVLETLEEAIAAIRPGMLAGALDALVRGCLPDLPHHVGHGIGWSFQEQPRIVPGARMELRPGMVVAIEPGIYGEREGIRLERVVLVREDGCELLSGHDLTL